MIEILISVLIIIGVFFILAGSIGLLRLPDLYNRTHAATKSATIGVMSVVLAATLFFSSHSEVTSGKLILTIVFVFITAPVAGQMISRAAYRVGVKVWDKSVMDDFKSQYRQTEARRDNDF